MATLTQTPDSLSLSRNIKDVIISSSSEVRFRLKKGTTVLLDENYQPDTSGQITIDIRDVVTSSLIIAIPTSDSYEQTGAVGSFEIYLDSSSSAAASFTAVLGGVSGGATASTFLPANFLTWQAQEKDVTADQPEWLTYYFAGAYSVKAKFYNQDGTDKTVTLMTGTAGKVYSVNCQFSHLWALGATTVDGTEKERYGFIDVWVENSGTRLTYVQRYCFRRSEALDEVYLCRNSIGGIDTFLFTGEKKLIPELEHTVGSYDNTLKASNTDAKRRYSQNTGILKAENSGNLWDFFRSLHAYYLKDGTVTPIVLDSSTIEYSGIDTANSWYFEYRLSDDDGLLKVQRSVNFPAVIEIPGPDQGTYYLAPRVVDYPSATLDSSLLMLLQSPYSQSWMRASLADLRTFFGSSGTGTSDHAALTNRDAAEQHPISAITGLLAALNGKAASSHSHAISDITNLLTTLNGKAASSHTHAISDITNLQTSLDAKVTANTAITAATKCKITYDTKGLVTAGEDLSESDIPTLSASKITGLSAFMAAVNEMFTLEGSGTSADPYIIKAKHDLYSIDGISAYGEGSGGEGGGSAVWGGITGTLSNQTDLANALAGKAALTHSHTVSQITDFPTFATVATSGSYNDLSNKPTIPTVPTNVSAFTNDAGYLTSHQSLSAYLTTAAAESTYLKLSGGTMTGSLKVATGQGVSDASGNGLIVYHPTSWTGVTNTQWGCGAIDCQGVIRSNASDLIHYKNGTNCTIYDSSNLTSSVIAGLGILSNSITGNAATATSAGNADTVDGYHAASLYRTDNANLTTVDWSCKALTMDGALFGATGITIYGGSNSYYAAIEIKDADIDDGYLYIQPRKEGSGYNINTVLNNRGGNVGVGITDPSYKLHIDGTLYASGNTNLGGTLGVTGAVTLNGGLSVTGNGYVSGNMGVGVASPSYKLHVNGDVGANHILPDANNTYRLGSATLNYAGVHSRQLINNTANPLWIWQGVSNSIRFSTDAAERAIIDASGNIGVGTTSPGQKLDVVGKLRLRYSDSVYVDIEVDSSGNLKINGNIYATGEFAAYQ